MLQTVQFCRALAVLLVVLYHGSGFIGPRYHVVPFGDVFSTGFAGVFLFFVISGFIILTAHYRDGGQPRQIGYYLARRMVRIYPFYWLVLMVWGGWRVFSGKLGLHELALNAILFEGSPTLIIPVSWTLRYEIIFYGLFTAFIISRKLGILVFAGWLALQSGHGPATLRWLVDPMNILFMLGLATAAIHLKLRGCEEKTRDRFGWGGLVIGTLGFLATMRFYFDLELDINAWPLHTPTILGFGLSSALLVLASTSPSVNRFLGQWRLMMLIGNASYSIYLLHSPFGKMAWKLARFITPLWQGEPKLWIANLLLVWLLVFATTIGIFIHIKVEIPLLKLLRDLISGGRSRA